MSEKKFNLVAFENRQKIKKEAREIEREEMLEQLQGYDDRLEKAELMINSLTGRVDDLEESICELFHFIYKE